MTTSSQKASALKKSQAAQKNKATQKKSEPTFHTKDKKKNVTAAIRG